MTRSLSKEKVNEKAGCRPRGENGYCRVQNVPSPWILGKQEALQERCVISIWEILANAGLRHAVMNWQWLKLCVGFLLSRPWRACGFLKESPFFMIRVGISRAAEVGNTQPVIQPSTRSWQSSKNWLKCSSFQGNRLPVIFLSVNWANMNNIV